MAFRSCSVAGFSYHNSPACPPRLTTRPKATLTLSVVDARPVRETDHGLAEKARKPWSYTGKGRAARIAQLAREKGVTKASRLGLGGSPAAGTVGSQQKKLVQRIKVSLRRNLLEASGQQRAVVSTLHATHSCFFTPRKVALVLGFS